MSDRFITVRPIHAVCMYYTQKSWNDLNGVFVIAFPSPYLSAHCEGGDPGDLSLPKC